MATPTCRYIRRHFKQLVTDPLPGVSVSLVDDNLYEWRLTIAGPEGSPYNGGMFVLKIRFGPDYPFKPPSICFKTKIFHPNVDANGNIFHPMLSLGASTSGGWQMNDSMKPVLLALTDMLIHPLLNDGDVFVEDIVKTYVNRRDIYDAQARMWTRDYATGSIFRNLMMFMWSLLTMRTSLMEAVNALGYLKSGLGL